MEMVSNVGSGQNCVHFYLFTYFKAECEQHLGVKVYVLSQSYSLPQQVRQVEEKQCLLILTNLTNWTITGLNRRKAD